MPEIETARSRAVRVPGPLQQAGRRIGRNAGWPRAFCMFVLSSGVASMAWIAFDGFLTPFLRQAGVSVVWIGYFYGLVGAVGVGAAVLGGLVADSRGRTKVLVAAAAVRFLAWSLVLAAPRSGWLTVCACMLGLGMAGGSAYLAYNAEAAPEGRRAFAFSVTGAVDGIVAMAVPVAVGFLADRFGLRAALIGGLVPGGLSIVLMSRLPETLERGGAGGGLAGRRTSPLSALGFIFSPAGRGALLMGLIWTVTGLQMGFMRPVWPMYVIDRFGVTYAGLGIVTTVSSLGMVAGQLLGGRIADRAGYSRLMITCLACTSALYFLVPRAGAPAAYALMLVVANLVGWTAAPCWGAVGSSSSSQPVRGAVAGLHASLRSGGTALGGVLSGLVYRRGITLPFYVLAATDLVIVTLVFLGARRGLAGFGRGRGYRE